MTDVMSTASAPAAVYLPEPARIEGVDTLTAAEKKFTLRLPQGRPLNHRPGQFVEVSLFGVGEAPISVCSPPLGQRDFELTVRRVGSVTEVLHRLQPGDTVGIRGPYGNGFNVAEFEGKDILFIAGGLGLAPLRSLVAYVAHPTQRSRFGKVTVLYGTRNPGELLFTGDYDRWREAGLDVRVTVDRAGEEWTGSVGVVTTLFEGLELDRRRTQVAIVGPPVMYRFALLEIFGKGIPFSNIRLSLERRMKCGLGVCGHCQINGLYVCKDGPVFRYNDIRNLDEAI